MLQELYAANLLPPERSIPEAQISLGIDTSGIEKTLKVKKTMSEEEAEAVRAKNEVIRKQREEICETIAVKFACFKRDFLGAPIRKAMNKVMAKQNDF